MKRLACLLSAVLFCCFLCACDPGTYSIDREALDDVVSIELIEYENPHQKSFLSWVPNHFHELTPFELANVTVLETLSPEKIPDFLDAFSETHILSKYYVYNSPKDICLRLNYANGDFLVIWADYVKNSFAGYIGEYSSEGAVLSFWGCFSAIDYYEDLVNQYFEGSLS